MRQAVHVNDIGQPLNETDMLVEAMKEGEQPRVRRKSCLTRQVNEVICSKDDSADEHVTVD